MENLKAILKLFYSPASAMSDLMDHGSWVFAAVAVLFVSMAFFATVTAPLETAYRIPSISEFYEPEYDEVSEAQAKAKFDKAQSDYDRAMSARRTIPLVGDRFFKFFSFDAAKFYQPLLALSVFYVPAAILLMTFFGIGSFGLVLRRDYGTLAVCTLSAWAAAHLPFAVVGILLYSQSPDPQVYLALWAASGLLFGVFMIFALRTALGTGYGPAVAVVGLAWLSLSLGTLVMQYVSPWLFSPFLLFYAYMYLGGSIGGEVRGFGNAMRQKQNFKRFLHNATVNPKDADAHVQLALIYLQRRQEAKAVDHLRKALEIDETEIDANYEMGKIERGHGNLQEALNHFATVVEQNDKHALSEVWREIGITYLDADMLDEAHNALEKFTIRRSADVEGLYYFGKVLKAQGNLDEARKMFEQTIDYAKAAPDFSRRGTTHWSKLAKKEL
ncbi:MAG: tetratricopeptide repeat protein [Acidobacteria bacterium]|nr:tetratricopeptide repeat protein [Acidobacteriota bacterium]